MANHEYLKIKIAYNPVQHSRTKHIEIRNHFIIRYHVARGDIELRSERIRTYNYPQNRVTDHRINLTINKLDQIMEGKLSEIIEALTIEEQTSKLDQVTE